MNEQAALTDRKRTLIFVNIIITCIATTMLSTALTTALPAISNELSVDVSTAQWLTSGYTLVMGIMMPLTAFLMTRFPTKRLYITGLSVFIAGLLFAIFAPGFLVLMAGRILQAAGTGILSSMGQVLILTIFPPERRGTAMGAYGLSISAAPVVAPTIAGILIDTVGWRMLFILILIIMLFSICTAAVVFENVLPTKPVHFDLFSFVLNILAFGGITLGVGNASSQGFGSVLAWIPLLIGIVAMILFVSKQLHSDEPLLDFRTLKNKNFAMGVIGSMLLYLILMGASVIIPLYVQNMKGYSATISGLVMLPGSIVSAVLSLIAGRIYDKIGIKKLFITGAACLLVSNLLTLSVSVDTSIWRVAAYNIIMTAGCGCLLTPLITWGVSGLKQELTSHATALLTSFRTVAGAIGSAVFVGLMEVLSERSTDLSETAASIHGFSGVFGIMAIFSAIMLCIPVFFLRKQK